MPVGVLSKMPQVYIHHLGIVSTKHLLQAFGLEKPYDLDLKNKLNSKIMNCPIVTNRIK